MFKVYKKILTYVPNEKYLAFISMLISFFSGFFTVTAYFFMYKFFASIIYTKNSHLTKLFSFYIAFFLVLASFAQFFANIVSHKLAFRVETNLRKRGIDILSQASFNFFNQNMSGNIRKTIDDNATQTHAIIAHLIPDNANAFITPILLLGLAFYIHYSLGLVLIFLIIITMFFVKKMLGKKKFMTSYQEALDDMSGKTVEYIRAMQVNKIFGLDIHSFKALNKAINSYSNNALKYAKSSKIPFVIFQLAYFGLPCFIIIVINIFKLQNYLLNSFFLIFLSGALYLVMLRIMYVFMYSNKGMYAIEQLEKLFAKMEKEKLAFGKIETFSKANIEFKNVSFSYTDNLILDNLSFFLEENKTYAFIGASGAGKSTIAKLLSGFYNISSGNILIDNIDISEYSKSCLTKNISFVFQNPKLFNNLSIFDNVHIANKNASKEEVLTAIYQAGCKNILDKLENKENTIIGSCGIHLSSGEIQRIAIARAFLKNSKILILDEASSSLDADNEYELKLIIQKLFKNKTVIIIAHKLTSISNVDKIFVIENGKIIESGTHSKLMTENKRYKHYLSLYKKANEWRVNDEKLDK